MTSFKKDSNEEWFRQIAENISEVFFIVDAKKKEMIYASPAHEKVFGLKPETLYINPKAWIEQIIPEDRETMYRAFENAEKQIAAEYPFRVQHPDGSIHQILSKVFPVKNEAGDVYRIVGVAEDVTEKKRAEELKKKADIFKAKEEFMLHTIHDLRAPTNIIRLAMQIYNDPEEVLRMDAERVREGIDLVSQANKRMSKLIEDLLTIIKEGQQAMMLKKENVDIAGIIQSIAKEFNVAAQNKKISIEYVTEKNAPVLADADKLKEVFANLIDNAIKYGKTGGKIIIMHEKQGNLLKTAVRDDGIGIADADIPKLFTPYFRTGQDPLAVGTGLGLYIVKSLVEKMDGEIEVSSVLGEGTTFTVSLLTT